jgi:hypothetical protein
MSAKDREKKTPHGPNRAAFSLLEMHRQNFNLWDSPNPRPRAP